MIIIYGSKLYGKVDVVPGLFHVETKFGHLWYIPLIPLESFVVLGKSGDGFNGIKIPMSFKSILYAWLRAGTLVAAIFATFITISMFDSGSSAWVTPAIVGLSALATFCVLSFHKGSTHASRKRAYQIGEKIGITQEGLLYLEQIYGPLPDPNTDPFLHDNNERFNPEV
jgi:hypothetical protein